MSYYNPFQNLELRIPEAYRQQVDHFCQTQPAGGTRPSPDDSPLPRQVDFWFLAVCVGAHRRRKVKVEKPHRFITGEILARDPHRIEFLELVAIALLDDPWIVGNPANVMELANELAAGGLPEVLAAMTDGVDKPIWNLTDFLANLVTTIGQGE